MYFCVFAKPEIPATYFIGLFMPRSVHFYSITLISLVISTTDSHHGGWLVLCSHTVGGRPTKTCHSDIHNCSFPCALPSIRMVLSPSLLSPQVPCALSYLRMVISPSLLSPQVPCALCYLLPPHLHTCLLY